MYMHLGLLYLNDGFIPYIKSLFIHDVLESTSSDLKIAFLSVFNYNQMIHLFPFF